MARVQNTSVIESSCLMDKMWNELSTIPAVFTLKVPEYISQERMKGMKSRLEEEMDALEKIPVKHEQDDEELVQALDLLTWLEYKIGSKQKALELNDKALALTNRQAAFSLGNCAHLMWCEGEMEQTRTCLDSLLRLNENDSSKENLAAVKAHQAYCYFRLGGRVSLLAAMDLFEEALKIHPNSFLWRLQAGIVNRRFTHPNIQNTDTPFDADTKKESLNRAENYFRRVAQGAPNPRLKAFAFSELAWIASIEKYSPDVVRNLCEKALSLCSSDPYVLLHCGKSLKRINDLPQALTLLKKASLNDTNPNAVAQVGSCFWFMAKNELKRSRETAEQYNHEAEKCYRKVVRLNPSDFSSHYSLAKFLIIQKRYEEALFQLQKLLVSSISSVGTSFAMTQMHAYQSAAFCQLQLCQDPHYVASLSNTVSVSSLKKDAEVMLIKALEIGFNILTPGERKKYLVHSIAYLQKLKNRNETPQSIQVICKVYHLANEKEKSLQALNKLLKQWSDNPNVIAFALQNYLDLGSYEEAYALLQMSSARFGADIFDEDLCRKVALSAAWARLLQISTGAARIFKAQFGRYRQQNHYLREGQSAGHQALSCETDGSAETELLDVLILYDDSRDGSKGESNLSNICRKLQQTMPKIFGLNVSYNVQGCCAGRLQVAVQLEEMARAELVLVVIDPEPMD
ncbi:hypothetical protein ElyMa_005267000, partial [Elysia marginata]